MSTEQRIWCTRWHNAYVYLRESRARLCVKMEWKHIERIQAHRMCVASYDGVWCVSDDNNNSHNDIVKKLTHEHRNKYTEKHRNISEKTASNTDALVSFKWTAHMVVCAHTDSHTIACTVHTHTNQTTDQPTNSVAKWQQHTTRASRIFTHKSGKKILLRHLKTFTLDV